MLGPYLCNTAWMVACFREAQAYRRSTDAVRQTQQRLLQTIVQENRRTWFGVQCRFATIGNVTEFQDSVPISGFEDYRGPIDRISQGEPAVLTAERVELLEPTGGTSRGEKLIPYTQSLRRAFQRAIKAWIWDLYSSRPAVRHGTAYWSISPLASLPRQTSGGIPIGFDEDAAYLGKFVQKLVEQTMAVPSAMALAPDVDSCRYATSFFLLRDPNLSLISVWSPTFLTALLRFLWANRNQLCNDVEKGKITPSHCFPELPEGLAPRPTRAEALRQAMRGADDISQCLRTIWPQLQLVSCWADGPSSSYANNLRTFLDGIEIQPKGLLATEAFVSIPLLSQPAPALAIRSHFFEFIPVRPSHTTSRPLLAHELSEGSHYEVLVTTQGGLYRYQLHDQVEIVGFYRQTPLMRFVGKTDATSDLVGEKLNDAHAQAVLQSAFAELGLKPRFAQLIADSDQTRYRLQIADATLATRPYLVEQLCNAIDAGFSENPAYRYARSLSQLQSPVVEIVNDREIDTTVTCKMTKSVALGQRLGDVKLKTFGE